LKYSTFLKEYQWRRKMTIFWTNAILGTTGLKAMLMNKYRLSLQCSQKDSNTCSSQQRQPLVKECLRHTRQL
jgi:hypothetical protein